MSFLQPNGFMVKIALFQSFLLCSILYEYGYIVIDWLILVDDVGFLSATEAGGQPLSSSLLGLLYVFFFYRMPCFVP